MFVPLEPGTWKIDMDRLQSALSDKTRLMIFNNPHNPTGKLYRRSEIEELVSVLDKYPKVDVVADEVYEEQIYTDEPMTRIGSLMWDRCISISSAGKLFSVTGWKTGWGVGGEEIMKRLSITKQWTTFCSNTP